MHVPFKFVITINLKMNKLPAMKISMRHTVMKVNEEIGLEKCTLKSRVKPICSFYL